MLVGKGKNIGIGVGLGILGFFIFVFVAGSMMIQGEEQELRNESIEEEQELRNMSIEELKELSVSWYYDDLLRNPEKYKGEIIFFRGEIFMVDSIGKDHYGFYVRTGTGEYGLDQLVVTWKGGMLLDGDEISGYGVYSGVVDVGSMLVENYYNPKPHVQAIHLTCYNC